jgi:hypothetical protein
MTDHDDRELFEGLGAAWRNQPVPQPGGDLVATDAVTQRTVQWLAAAWAAQAVPPVRLPARITRRHARTAWRVSWRPLAAAAVLILILTVPLMQREPGPTPVDHGTPPPVVAANPLSPPQTPTVTADGLELRSGPVRLLLLSKTTTTTIEEPR